MADLEERRVRRGPSVLTIVVLVLAVIGFFSIIGTVMSTFWFVVRTAALVVGLVVIAYILWRVFIGRPDRD